jgi:hypothetical protein
MEGTGTYGWLNGPPFPDALAPLCLTAWPQSPGIQGDLNIVLLQDGATEVVVFSFTKLDVLGNKVCTIARPCLSEQAFGSELYGMCLNTAGLLGRFSLAQQPDGTYYFLSVFSDIFGEVEVVYGYVATI